MGLTHKSHMGILAEIVAVVLICYGVYCTFLFLMQRTILFPRNQIPSPGQGEPPVTDSELKKIWLKTAYGKVEAWFIPATAGSEGLPAPVVIFAHGNGELIDYWPQLLQNFARMGIGLLLVEYPGYGRSGGRPSQKSITHTFVAAYDMLLSQKGVDPTRIVLFGRSVGGGAVCALSLQRRVAALILMSTFTSVHSMASKFLVPPFLVRDPFNNLKAVQQYPGPLLVIHGRHDRMIPYDHGATLHRAAPNSAMITYDAGHNDCPPDWNQFWEDMALFLADNEIVSSPIRYAQERPPGATR